VEFICKVSFSIKKLELKSQGMTKTQETLRYIVHLHRGVSKKQKTTKDKLQLIIQPVFPFILKFSLFLGGNVQLKE